MLPYFFRRLYGAPACLCLLILSYSLRAKSATIDKTNACPTATFSFTTTGVAAVSLTNQGGSNTATVVIRAGGYMQVGNISSDAPLANLRFIETMTTNGNVVFEGYRVPSVRAPQELSSSYFNRAYGPYTLVDPTLTGTQSETFTPYVDLNGNQQYDAASECLGLPVVLNYVIYPACTIQFSVSGSTSVTLTNQNGPATATINLCAGGWMGVGALTSSISSNKLRFVEAVRSNGNLVFKGYTVPLVRPSQDLDRTYFNQVYGPYTLNDPAVTGTQSETFTPYIDQNGNNRFDAAFEFLDTPVVLNYEVKTNNTQASVQAASWSSPSTWSCGRVPAQTDQVLIRHSVILPAGYAARSYQLVYEPGGSLVYNLTSQLFIINRP